MTDPAEVYRWQTWFAEHGVEKRPAPVEMTDTEILDFADEYADMIQQIPADSIYPRRFVIDIEGMDTVRAGSLREAVKLAAARMEENE